MPKKSATGPKKSTPKKKAAKKRPTKPASKTPGHTSIEGLYGSITHTDFASTDPLATRDWAAKALGWKFKPSMKMQDGSDYHLFAYSAMGGGGVRQAESGESISSVPYVHVASCDKAYAKAISAGAEPIQPPDPVIPGLKIAIVRAPGGVTIGLSGP